MIYLRSIKLGKIKDYFLDILSWLAEHLFLTFLILIFISLLFGSAVFYKYYFLPKKIEPALSQEAIKFQENVYSRIIQEWQSRGERFEAAKTKKYPDPFKP